MKTRGYEEHMDYDIAVAHDLGSEKKEEFSKAVVRVNVFRDHQQTMQVRSYDSAHIFGI